MEGSELEMINQLAQKQEEVNEETSQQEQTTEEQNQDEITEEQESEQETDTDSKQEQNQESSLTESQEQQEQPPAEQQQEQKEDEVNDSPKLDIKEWLKENKDSISLLNEDLSSVNLEDEDTVENYLLKKYINDGYSRSDAEIMLEDAYPTFFDPDADPEDEDVIKKSNREFVKMKNEAKRFVDELKSKQAELNLDFPIDQSYDEQVIEKYKTQQQENYNKQLEQVRSNNENLAKSIVSEIKELKFDDGDGGEFTYQLSKEDEKMFTEEFKDYTSFFDRNFGEYDKDGKLTGVKKDELVKAVIVTKKLPEIIKIAMGTGGSKGRKDLLKKDIKNTTISDKSTSPRETYEGDDVVSQGVRKLREGVNIFK